MEFTEGSLFPLVEGEKFAPAQTHLAGQPHVIFPLDNVRNDNPALIVRCVFWEAVCILESHPCSLSFLFLEGIPVGFGVVEGDPVVRDVALT